MSGPVPEEHVALLALLRAPGRRTWPQIAAEVAFTGSALSLWQAREVPGLFPEPGEETALADARAELAGWQARGLRLVTVLDEAYPRRLLDIRETPPFIFVRGDLQPDDRGMSVVGSRIATGTGLTAAASAARLLVDKGLSVIAGLAAGIDTAAHEAALQAGGRTVAIIGTGITGSYPPANAALQETIASKGLLLSQFLPDAPPSKTSFPMRNAVMSGYGLATIVIEAGETSGTRIQARLAVEHGRPVILTASVAGSTTWGRTLADRPGVHVVNDLAELEQAIDTITAEPDQLRAALVHLAGSRSDPAA